jgi:hypothetical protein
MNMPLSKLLSGSKFQTAVRPTARFVSWFAVARNFAVKISTARF